MSGALANQYPGPGAHWPSQSQASKTVQVAGPEAKALHLELLSPLPEACPGDTSAPLFRPHGDLWEVQGLYGLYPRPPPRLL